MARRRRQFEVFSMSFLDCMSCGFGAVILFFMIINAQVKETTEQDPTELMAETRKLEIEILDGRKNLVLAKNTMADLTEEKQTAEGQIAQIIALIEQLRAELAKYDKDTLAEIEAAEQLQTDIENLEEEVKRLLALAEEQEQEGNKLREFKGEGDRQYLTGLKLGGSRTLILVDRSASMLDDTIVNIIRRRNMADEDKLRAVKWRQAVASVDWQIVGVGDSPHAAHGALELLADRLEYGHGRGTLVCERRILARDIHVGLGKGHLDIADQCVKKRPRLVHAAQERQSVAPFLDHGLERRAEAVPGRQCVPGLSPPEYPGNRPDRSLRTIRPVAV